MAVYYKIYDYIRLLNVFFYFLCVLYRETIRRVRPKCGTCAKCRWSIKRCWWSLRWRGTRAKCTGPPIWSPGKSSAAAWRATCSRTPRASRCPCGRTRLISFRSVNHNDTLIARSGAGRRALGRRRRPAGRVDRLSCLWSTLLLMDEWR